MSKAAQNMTAPEKTQFYQQRKDNPQPLKRSRLILLKTRPLQHQCLLRWIKDARTTYNLAVAYVKKHSLVEKQLPTEEIEKILNPLFVPWEALTALRKEHLGRTPKVPRQQVIKGLCSSIQAFYTKCKTRKDLRSRYPKTLKFQQNLTLDLKFKTRWILNDSLKIEKSSFTWKDKTHFNLYVRSSKGVLKGIETADAITPEMFNVDLTLSFRYGKWYLVAPVDVDADVKLASSPTANSVCALDPGIRKFLTVYSPEGKVEYIGANAQQVIQKGLRRIQRRKTCYSAWLQRHRTRKQVLPRSLKRQQRKKLALRRKRYHKALIQSENAVKDFHYKVAHYLCTNYKEIVYPYFSPQSCSNRQKRKIGSTVVLQMMALRHATFKNRLVQTLSKYEGVKDTPRVLVRCSEAYTTMQCGSCGVLNPKVGGNEEFQCPQCGLTADRDAHAARNILLRALG